MISERQYRSAVIARAFYFETSPSIPEWRTEIAAISSQRIGTLEPPISELIASFIYRFIGGENLRLAKYISLFYWLLGGWFLFQIAKTILSFDEAVFAILFYLFAPLGVLISISFLPDPLMILLFLVSLYLILRYYKNTTISKLVLAAVAAGIAIFVKPFVLFGLIFTFVFMAIYYYRDFRKVIDRNLFIFIVISLLPTAAYYGYQVAIGGFLKQQAQGSIIPQLLFSPDYWKDWLNTANRAVGSTALIAALLGFSLFRKGLPRFFVVGLWIGYIVFCLVFSNHIRFAAYYHSQLIIIVALSLGSLITLLITEYKRNSTRWVWLLPTLGVIILIAVSGLNDLKERLESYRGFESQVIAQEIGELVNHSTQVIYVAPYYGMPLQYHGELSGTYWPRSISDRDRVLGQHNSQSVADRIKTLDFSPEYYVITDFEQFNTYHTDLKEYLVSSCSLLARTDNYLIYSNCLGDI
jgi:4-amino-4-deoxy-L-arabinose transferase-like glycosyltransferase